MEWRVPLTDLNFDQREIDAAVEVLRSGWLTMGPRVRSFELRWAQLHRARHAVAVANCTAALHLACRAAGFGPGDEVLCPALTFVATAAAIRQTGARPVFVDIIAPEFPLLDPEQCAAALNARTRGLIAVHYAGYPAPMEQLDAFCRAHKLSCIEDAAHAPLVEYRGKFLGAWGAAGCFSFFSNKNMTTAEGGMLLTDSDEIAATARLLRSHAMTTGTLERHADADLSYDVTDVGYNYRLDEIRAAIGLAQLEKLEAAQQARKERVRNYRAGLRGTPGLAVPFQDHPDNAAYHLFTVLIADGAPRRDEIRRQLHRRGIQTSVHYPPLQLFSAYRETNTAPLPNTEDYARRAITLPLFPGMTGEQQQLVIDALKELLAAGTHAQ